MNRIALIALVLSFAACKGSQQAADHIETPVNTELDRPEWVRSRPITDHYYIGVGRSSKALPEPYETAKKNALNELASEISVIVEGNSLLHSIETRQRFDESFTSTIKMRTSEQLEGFELVDSWENDKEYWVYYRLSKAEHARLKAEKRSKALGTAKDHHSRSKESLATGDLRSAFDQLLRGLLAMKEYWGENDLVEVDGRQVPLANEMFNDLQKLTSSVQFSALPERCVLDLAGDFKREMLIRAQYRNNGSVQDLVQLPIKIEYPGSAGKVIELKNTDADGHVRTTVQKVTPNTGAVELKARLDMDALVSRELDRALVDPLIASLTVPELHVPIDLRMPSVYMRSSETNLGGPVNEAGVSFAVREELTRMGFRFVDSTGEADLLIDLNASTRKGGESNGFFTTFLDLSLTFRDRRSQQVVYEGGKQGVKGVQLDHARAGLDAYKRAAQDVKKEIVPAMMSSIL